jgi:type I restriction enzyme S subunit
MSEWRKIKLSEIAILRRDGTVPNEFQSFPYIGLEHIEPKGLRLNSIGKSSDVTSQKSKFYPSDILYGKLRPYFQKVYYPSFEGICSTDIFVIKAKNGIDSKFLFYLIASDEFTNLANNGSTGTRMPRADWKHLSSTIWNIPPLPTQKAIAEILSSLDDKIELNNQINQNLEALAQALFKQWFVDFEFPNENGEPYKSSGGEMVDSELGEIPKGWEVGVLQNLTVEFNSGGTPKTSIREYYVGEIEWYSTKELQDCFLTGSEKKISEEGLKKSSAKLFPKNSVIMAIYAAPTVGRLGILLNDASFNQAAVGLVANEEITSFEYIFLLLKHERQGLNSLSNGAAQQNLNVRIVKNYSIVIPNKSLSSTFKDVARPIFEKIRINTLESENLMKLRDTLLPKLISGELEVNESLLEPTF